MSGRTAEIIRKTSETDITIKLNIDGVDEGKIETPVGFLNHMLILFASTSRMSLFIKAKGDTCVDEHHTTEDIGIVLGEAFAKALGEKKGINRYGFFILPMDEALATVAVDFSGRYSFTFNCSFNREKIADMSTELFYDFWDAFAQNAKVNLFIKVENGRNDHHKAEAIFKAVGRACRMACNRDDKLQLVPSTKGKL
jgi:imidazoleglycerol-phosphate dehydratase / histidinol-phosphatase